MPINPINIIKKLFILLILTQQTSDASATGIPMGTLMRKLCLTSYKAKMQIDSKDPPPEIGKYACECFVTKTKDGLSIKKARSKCKDATIEKFDLE